MNNFLQKKSIQTKEGEIFYFSDNDFLGRPTIIFLHGLSSNHTTWINIMATLKEHKYNSLALDLRGHGYSDKRKKKSIYKWSTFSEDLEQIIEEEKLVNFILVGYSFGGEVAIDYTLKYPSSPRGIILISTNYVNPFQYKKISFLRPVIAAGAHLLAWLLIWQKRKKYLYYEHREAVGYWDSTFDGLKTMPLSVNLWMLLMMGSLDFRGKLGQITCPVRMVVAKGDPFVSSRETEDMQKEFKNAEIIVSKNTSHFVASAAQTEVAEILLNFLKQYENSDF